MKINKVLLGLFAGVMALVGGNASATQDTNFVEIGPVNVGGHVTSLVADRNDSTTIYAGSATGGLFVRTDNQQTLNKLYQYRGMSLSYGDSKDIWHYVPYRDENGVEVVLPISCMVQSNDNSLFIGTGSDEFAIGSVYAPMSAVGRGIFIYNTTNPGYEVIPGTVPTNWNSDWAAVRKLDFIKDANGDIHLFAVTKNHIYRINRVGGVWQTPEPVFDGDVDQFIIVRSLRLAYFTVGNELYKIGNLNGSATALQTAAVRVMNADVTFGGNNSALKIAVAPSDPSYLYVMVIKNNGMMLGLYLTRNLQTWQTLTTSTVSVFTRTLINRYSSNSTSYVNWAVNGDGRHCGAIYVDPEDPQHVILGGSTLWSGRNLVEGSYYQWTMMSYCEQNLNYGNYMGSVFGNPSFVHSGIHQIICAPRVLYGSMRYVYYIATDGGVYSSYNDLNSYQDMNRGLNIMQTNSIAVSPDASVFSGAHNGACPLVEARSEHDGGLPEVEWYDDGSHGSINHDALITWKDNGGMVGASMFQQYAPNKRRTVFASSRDNQFGRCYADYMDYTQTQTWTIDQRFISNSMVIGQQVSFMSFWETNHDTYFNDSIEALIDTLGYVMRDTNNDGSIDTTIWMNSGNFQIKAGDKMTVLSRAQAYYPIDYTFTRNMTAGDGAGHANKIKVKNPMQSRMLIIGRDAGRSSMWTVWLSWRATDFSKVYDEDAPKDTWNEWAGIYYVDTTVSGNKSFIPRSAVMSADGRMAYIAVVDRSNNSTMIVRVKGFENADFSKDSIWEQISCQQYSNTSILSYDTLKLADGSRWLPRVVSSMTADTSLGAERLILTFEDYSTNYANVAIVTNSQGDWSANKTVNQIEITGHKELPAYCAFVEDSTKNIYVGTADGVWIKSSEGWNQYEHLRGVAVTSMVQQKAKMPARRHIGHNGINPEYYLFPKTKWPGAMYFGTYGRGIFMDMTYVSDRSNTILDDDDYTFGIPTVKGNGAASLSIFPNPVVGEAHLAINATEAADAQLRIYDLNGRCVSVRNLGRVAEGEQVYTISTEGMPKGLYLVNVIMGGHTSATKMMVR